MDRGFLGPPSRFSMHVDEASFGQALSQGRAWRERIAGRLCRRASRPHKYDDKETGA
ncbi:hypothetical protein BRAS3809_7490007 [Bradyrhizobium sp. STM 3809]|nr:hypothetical protein BRAS3809_7490007 [Bradyrhizobium sp. STM 3809]